VISVIETVAENYVLYKFQFEQMKHTCITHTQELEYIFFVQNFTLGYMTKTLNQIIIFFSNIGNQNIFLEKNHTPPFKLNGRSLMVMSVVHILGSCSGDI
jgi:hypothetical protein